jgi:hypothetical protein
MLKKILYFFMLLILSVQVLEASQQKNSSLDLTAQTEKTDFFVAEPITIKGLLHNNEDINRKILYVSQCVYYRQLGREYIPYTSNRNLSDGFISTIPMDFKHNDIITRQETLLYNADTEGFVLEYPGLYEFKVSMTITLVDGGSQEYTSKPIQIKVLELSKEDKIAFKELKKLQLGRFLNGLSSRSLSSFEGLDEQAEKAILFVKSYRDSSYASLVSNQTKNNLNLIKRELELTKQAMGEELPPELESMYNKVKTIIELEVDEN